MKPFFSIVIPVLNEEAFLPKLLACLEHQRHVSFEVIIVDGKSEDETVAKASTYKKTIPLLTIITSQKRNVSYQRNIGARRAKGEYIIFFDADVLIPDNFLSDVFTAIDTYGHVLMTTYLRSSDGDVRKYVLTNMANILLGVTVSLGKPTAGGFNILVKRTAFFDQGGFDESIVYGEDYEFIQRCYNNGIVLKVLKEPQLICSFRRFDRYGYAKVLWEFLYGSAHSKIKGPIREHIFDYPMGGEMVKK